MRSGIYVSKPMTVEIINFEDFVEIGREANPENAAAHGGIPWRFNYRGMPVTHENDDCYLISRPVPLGQLRFERNKHVLFWHPCGELQLKVIQGLADCYEMPVAPHERREQLIQDLHSRKFASAKLNHVKLPIMTFDSVMQLVIMHHRLLCTVEGVSQPEDRV